MFDTLKRDASLCALLTAAILVVAAPSFAQPTEAQKVLQAKLGEQELGKFKLTRQQVIGSAIVDFACNPLKIAVSIDEGGDPALTARRDKSLEAVGVRLLRFAAARVIEEPDAVVAEILAAMKASYDERGRARRQHYQTRGAPHGYQGRNQG